jgi:hypothetical protein
VKFYKDLSINDFLNRVLHRYERAFFEHYVAKLTPAAFYKAFEEVNSTSDPPPLTEQEMAELKSVLESSAQLSAADRFRLGKGLLSLALNYSVEAAYEASKSMQVPEDPRLAANY